MIKALKAILGGPRSPAKAEFKATDFELPDGDAPGECDLVLKGGVTSGVVYPYAILELARRYRFRSVGGTSAGGIAAAFAAAASSPGSGATIRASCDSKPDAWSCRGVFAACFRLSRGSGLW